MDLCLDQQPLSRSRALPQVMSEQVEEAKGLMAANVGKALSAPPAPPHDNTAPLPAAGRAD